MKATPLTLIKRLKKYGFFVICMIGIIYLQYPLWRGDTGFFNMKQLNQTANSKQKTLENLENKNKQLKTEVNALSENSALIEEKARTELHFIKPGETYYQTSR